MSYENMSGEKLNKPLGPWRRINGTAESFQGRELVMFLGIFLGLFLVLLYGSCTISPGL
jgi:hypothetical protein